MKVISNHGGVKQSFIQPAFSYELKWYGVIALGYGASILCHLWLNAHLM